MKKTLIALAALAATGAFAQSSVSLYGRVDAGYANLVDSYTTGGTTTEQRSNGVASHNSVSSYWGLQGVEDLGGGLKANFKFEADLFPVTGATGTTGADNGYTGTADRASNGQFNRTSLLGLSGNFGRIDFGRDYLPTFSLAAATDVFGQSSLTTVGLSTGKVTTANGGTTVLGGVGSTVSRQVIYTTPNFSGFTGKLSYGNSDRTVTGTGAADAINRNTNVSGVYSNGPLYVGLAFGVNEAVVTASTTKNELTVLGASYDFGSFKLVGNYISAKETATNRTTDTTATETNLGVTVPFGAVTAIAQIGRNTYSSSVATQNGDISGNDWAIGADYALSKRTTAFVKTGVSNKSEGTIAGAAYDQKRTATSIGIRHTF